MQSGGLVAQSADFRGSVSLRPPRERDQHHTPHLLQSLDGFQNAASQEQNQPIGHERLGWRKMERVIWVDLGEKLGGAFQSLQEDQEQ